MDGQTQSMIQPFLAMLYFFGLKVDLQLVFARFDAANLLLKKANTTCLDDLMKLSEAELYEIYCNTDDGESLSYFSYAPLRGEDSIIPEDPYQAILDGAGKDAPDFCLL